MALARSIASALGVPFTEATAEGFGVAAVAAVLTNLAPGAVLFIDKADLLPHATWARLCYAASDFAIDLTLHKPANTTMLRVDLPRFCLLTGSAEPLRSRRLRFALTIDLRADDQPPA